MSRNPVADAKRGGVLALDLDCWKAVAAALGVRCSAVTLIRGATSRDKLIDVDGDDSEIRPRLQDC